MSDYIEREAVLEIVKRTSGDYVAAWSEIAHMSAADVAPVRHGRWHFAEDSVFRCSECGRICLKLNAPYCYCGAKMDGEETHTCHDGVCDIPGVEREEDDHD